MDFPPRLRLLSWDSYPGKCLPRSFNAEFLVGLDLKHNMLETLWEGAQLLPNLKKMDLSYSLHLKEFPDLSKATNLEGLHLECCMNLVEIHSSIGNLPKLECLEMSGCVNLQIVPTLFNSASLDSVTLLACRQLRKIPDIYGNITFLAITDTMLLEELPESVSIWSRLRTLYVGGSLNMEILELDFEHHQGSGADIERIPDRIKDLHGLKELYIIGCPRLASLPELPPSLSSLEITGCPKLASLPELPSSLTLISFHTCESLESLISFPIGSQIRRLYFINCFKLDHEARRVITQQPIFFITCLPGWEVPAEFEHRAKGNSLTIPSGFCRFRFCLVVTSKPHTKLDFVDLLWRSSLNGGLVDIVMGLRNIPLSIQGEHLCIFPYEFSKEDGWLEHDNEIVFQFSTSTREVDVIECGVHVLTDKTDRNVSDKSCSEQVFEDDDAESLSDESYKSCSEQVYEDNE